MIRGWARYPYSRGHHFMPALHLDHLPGDLYEHIRQLAASHRRTLEAEALSLLQQGLLAEVGSRSQADLLADLRRRSYTPPPGTPDSVELLREDRGR
jgi:plasmid stability protein